MVDSSSNFPPNFSPPQGWSSWPPPQGWSSWPPPHFRPSPRPPYYTNNQNQTRFQYAALAVLCCGAIALSIIFWKCCRKTKKDRTTSETQTQTQSDTYDPDESPTIPPPAYNVIYDPDKNENLPPYNWTSPKGGNNCQCSARKEPCSCGYTTEIIIQPSEAHITDIYESKS